MIPLNREAIQGPDLEYLGKRWQVEYYDSDTFTDLPPYQIAQIYSVAFCRGKLLIGRGPRDRWALLGGTPNPGETWQGTLFRKLLAEANMVTMSNSPLGYQVLSCKSQRLLQLRAVSIVEPRGPFEGDPGGKISEIMLIDPMQYRSWFNWGDVGERLITRGLELAAGMTSD
jgi:hypothetical protein